MYGYSIGHIGQSITYGFISTYLVVYLTDGVGLSSSTAATISALALIVEFFVGMIVGNASDNCTSKMGRRRPFMMTAGIFIIPIMAMLFHIFDFGSSFNFAYYLLFAILFRVCFASWEITNAAFGAEIALGYDERTKLRTISRVCSVFGNGVAYVLPVYMLELFDTKEAAWEITGVFVAAVASVSWFTSVIVNRGRGVILTERLEEKGKGLGFLSVARNYLELLKLKSARILVLYKVGFTCSYALINVALMYYMEYSAGLSNNFKTYVFYISTAISAVMIPVVSRMAIAMGKAMQQAVMMLVSGIGGIIVYLVNPSSVTGAVIFFGVYTLAQTSFWQLSNAVFYDIVEVDEWVNNKRREGDMSSLISVTGTIISSFMIWIFGILFDIAGYDPSLAVQPSGVVPFLNAAVVLVPSVLYLLCFAALKACPINKKTFESLQKALALRKEGKDYSMYMDDVNKILGKKN